jgi:hypothetical protein
MTRHKLSSEPDVFITDRVLSYANILIEQAENISGKMDMAVVICWLNSMRILSDEEAKELKNFEKSTLAPGRDSAIENKFLSLGTAVEPHVSLGVSEIDKCKNITAIGNIRFSIDKDSLSKLNLSEITVDIEDFDEGPYILGDVDLFP